MGIVNKSFSLFNKGIGAATGFARNHMFPAMKTDYMAIKAGGKAINQYADLVKDLGWKRGISNLSLGFQHTRQSISSIYQQSNRSALMGGLRLGGYTAGIGGLGMWGLNRVTRGRTPEDIYNR